MNLIKDSYTSKVKIYDIKKPNIASGMEYYFTTDSGLEYEVGFGKKKNNYQGHVINFSVLSDEYEDEYSETNKGEIYEVIATVIEIVNLFHKQHTHSNTYEFTGEFKEGNEDQKTSIRTKLYYRYANQIIDLENWDIIMEGNKVAIVLKQ